MGLKEEKAELLKYWESEKIITDKNILRAFKNVKRESFIPDYIRKYSYEDIPLHILDGQTISQPTTVALMTQALKPEQGDKILEVGTGSGYQAAVLSEIVGIKGRIITIEFLKSLYLYARKNLKKLKNVKQVLGDGSKGYPSLSPFDRIIVTAASPEIPEVLIKQLKVGGVLVVPVGDVIQDMVRITKTSKGYKKEDLGEFRFVPLKGKYGFR